MTFLNILTLLIIGLSLSIDAFSLSLAYGMLNISKKQSLNTSLMVGLFHFFMPIIGNLLGNVFIKYIKINSKFVLLIVLTLILIEMIKSLHDDNKEYELNILNIIVFAFLVSVDSFSLGIGMNYITSNILLASTIFSIMSFSFTFLGFMIGKYFNYKAQSYARYIGITLLFTIIIYFLCKH